MSLVQVRQVGRVAVIRLDDAKRRNILSGPLCAALSEAVAAANADAGTHAIVVTGAPPAFCAGADLDDLQAAAEGRTDAVRAVYKAFIDVADSPLPTIAAVNGAAIGAGFNLALACDLRVASDDAVFDTRFLNIGLHPGGGHAWLLHRAVGWAEASRLLLLGRVVRGAEACRIGLVQQLAPASDVLDEAVELARRADVVPRELLLRTKASLRHAARSTHQAAFEHETAEQFWSLGQPAFAELVERLKLKIASR